jgi:arylsulfatase A-like enzyme
MMTGQYPRTLGFYANEDCNIAQPDVLLRMVPMQRAFHDAGYRTFTTGKRHLFPTFDNHWDYSAGDLWHKTFWNMEIHDNLNYWTWVAQLGLLDQAKADWGPEYDPKKPWRPMESVISVLPPNATMEAFAAAQTIDFLKSPGARQQPFFAWTTFYRPHQPWTPQQKYADKIDYASLHLPATIWQKAQELPPGLCQARLDKRNAAGLGWADETLYRRHIGYYIALVHEIDAHVGSILNTLEEQGLAENTIVIYSSDHGSFVGGHGMTEKWPYAHNFYEDTLRVPLLFRWPGHIQSGAVRQDLTELVDLYPTLISLCGLSTPTGYSLPGRDLSATLTRGEPVGRKYTVSENMIQASVITDDFKYGQWINEPKPKPGLMAWGNMLMSRTNDPDEIHNLINDPGSAEKKKELQGYLQEWTGKVDDSGRRGIFAKAKAEYTVL